MEILAVTRLEVQCRQLNLTFDSLLLQGKRIEAAAKNALHFLHRDVIPAQEESG